MTNCKPVSCSRSTLHHGVGKESVTCSSVSQLSKLNSSIRVKKYEILRLLVVELSPSSVLFYPNIPRSPVFSHILRDLHPVPTSRYRYSKSSVVVVVVADWRACSPTTKHSLDTGRPTQSRSAITGEQHTAEGDAFRFASPVCAYTGISVRFM